MSSNRSNTSANLSKHSSSSKKSAITSIEPNKCCIEDFEILAFENEEQLNYYTVWHEALHDKRREERAETERERQIIRSEIARKTRQLIGCVDNEPTSPIKPARSRSGKSRSRAIRQSNASIEPAFSSQDTPSASATSLSSDANESLSPARRVSSAAEGRRAIAASWPCNSSRSPSKRISHSANERLRDYDATNQSAHDPDVLPAGYALFNPAKAPNTINSVNGKLLMKYKLTKLYNKYHGRQTRRNFVLNKQMSARIDAEISKSYLNSWLAYNALQALRVPDSNPNALSTPTNMNKKILAAMPAQQTNGLTGTIGQSTPMQLVYIEQSNLITYSNRINPRQIADHKRKSHLPSSASSKKSSAASYDAFEIMDVLANTNKTNVTITRNANKPSQDGKPISIYSHSVNANTPGIVSTQLHLQRRSYTDMLSKIYASEAESLIDSALESDSGQNGDIESEISKYIKFDSKFETKQPLFYDPSKIEALYEEDMEIDDHTDRLYGQSNGCDRVPANTSC